MYRRIQGKMLLWGYMFACVRTRDIPLDYIIPEKVGFYNSTKEGLCLLPTLTPIAYSHRALRILCLGCFRGGVGAHSLLVFDQSYISNISCNNCYTIISVSSFRITLTMDSVDPVKDPRISHCYAHLNGRNYRMTAQQLPYADASN